MFNEEFKQIIQLKDIVIQIDNVRLTSTTVLKKVFSLIKSFKHLTCIQFSRAKAAKRAAKNKKKRDNKKKMKQKVQEGKMKAIREIEYMLDV